MKEREGRK